jgi:hypothetical protein
VSQPGIVVDSLARWPAYIPVDAVARAVAVRLLDYALRHAWDHGNIRTTVARTMNDDGTVVVSLVATSGDLSDDLFGDPPSIHGVAWIRRDLYAGWWPEVWYAFPDQEHTTAVVGNSGAAGVPVDFGDRHGRDLYGSEADDAAMRARRERDILDGVLHGGRRVGDLGYWLGGQFIEVE